jgi:hypothetical protein
MIYFVLVFFSSFHVHVFLQEETATKVAAMKDLVFPRNEVASEGKAEEKVEGDGKKAEYVPEPWKGPLYIVMKYESPRKFWDILSDFFI